MEHRPVMADEIVSIFAVVPEGVFIDATIGLGGHALAVEEKMPGKFDVMGFDRDEEMLTLAKKRLPAEFRLAKMNYSRIPSLINNENVGPVTAVLFDPGLNSVQLEESDRGFSYRRSDPLDLRFDRAGGRPFYDEVDSLSLQEMTEILKKYGQEKNSRAIAKAIVENRPKTTDELSVLIKRVVGPRKFVKAASRVFQAIRIFVNNELDELEKALRGIIPLISKGGRIAVISYHSLEDGIVKRIFRLYSGKCQCGPDVAVCRCGTVKILDVKTKKPLLPGRVEILENPRARSAKLRYAEKI